MKEKSVIIIFLLSIYLPFRSVVLAVAVSGEGTEECVSEYSPLHLTSDSSNAKAEVELFFPDLLTPQEQEEEPQTQMQIEQSKEGEAAS